MCKLYTQWTKLHKDDVFIKSTEAEALYLHGGESFGLVGSKPDYQLKKRIVGSLLFRSKKAEELIPTLPIKNLVIVPAREILKNI